MFEVKRVLCPIDLTELSIRPLAYAGAIASWYRAAFVAGRAYREILRIAAEEKASLIVMGAQGRGGPALTPLGSTTQQVVRAASCPVLTVRALREEGCGS